MLSGIQTGSTRLSPLILWPLVAISMVVIGLLLQIIYNVAFHPLCKYPGPKLWAATRIPYALVAARGQTHKEILALHQYYDAEIIRVSPNELSFQHPDAMKEIMGHRKGKAEENAKDPDFIDKNHMDIISANREDHSRYRRILSNGFSAKSMQEQQPIIKSYIDLLIERLHGICSKGPVDVVAWYNYTTFDIIGDLAFGQSFGCFDKSDYHPWVKVIFQNIKMICIVNITRSFKVLEPILKAFIPKEVMKKGMSHRLFVREKVDQRISLGTPRPDFAETMLKKGPQPMNLPEMYENANVLIVAGSETTATALSGCTYLLLANPDKLAKLQKEIRTSFQNEDEIDLLSTAKLEYLHAVLEETLRSYPPVPVALPRITPPAGQEILGQWIPGNIFSKPFEFHPERWLGDPAFADDHLEALKPFHTGPRNCLGMNLAYAEMKMILAKVIWNFDLQLAAQSQGWIYHDVYILYNKPPLMVHLTPAVKASE